MVRMSLYIDSAGSMGCRVSAVSSVLQEVITHDIRKALAARRNRWSRNVQTFSGIGTNRTEADQPRTKKLFQDIPSLPLGPGPPLHVESCRLRKLRGPLGLLFCKLRHSVPPCLFQSRVIPQQGFCILGVQGVAPRRCGHLSKSTSGLLPEIPKGSEQPW